MFRRDPTRSRSDCNYHSEVNLETCATYRLDAYIPDNHFRQRDGRFATQERYKRRVKKENFTVEDFEYEEKSDTYLCPQGKVLRLHARAHRTNRGETYRRYRSRKEDCARCPLRQQCLRRGAERKSLALPIGDTPATLTARMRQKIDQPQARQIYSRRLAIVEPVFANLRSCKRLDRFTYRGQVKVNIQWLLYCLVHNLEKLAHRGKRFRPRKPGIGLSLSRFALLKPLLWLLKLLYRLPSYFYSSHLPHKTFRLALAPPGPKRLFRQSR
jgi:hypothetical protein